MSPYPPFTIPQLLWVNFGMGLIVALALATLPPVGDEKKLLTTSSLSEIFSRRMLKSAVLTGVYFAVLMVALMWVFSPFTLDESGVYFTFFCLLQYWNVFFIARGHMDGGLRGLLKCPLFWLVMALLLIIQLSVMDLAYTQFDIAPMNPVFTLIDIAVSFVAVAMKIIINKK